MKQLIEAMKENTNVKILTMCNIDMPDSVAKVLLIEIYINLSSKWFIKYLKII